MYIEVSVFEKTWLTKEILDTKDLSWKMSCPIALTNWILKVMLSKIIYPPNTL
jgi:hypothetical protein